MEDIEHHVQEEEGESICRELEHKVFPIKTRTAKAL